MSLKNIREAGKEINTALWRSFTRSENNMVPQLENKERVEQYILDACKDWEKIENLIKDLKHINSKLLDAINAAEESQREKQ